MVNGSTRNPHIGDTSPFFGMPHSIFFRFLNISSPAKCWAHNCWSLSWFSQREVTTPLGWDASESQGSPSAFLLGFPNNALILIYTPIQREPQHTESELTKAPTWTYLSEVGCSYCLID